MRGRGVNCVRRDRIKDKRDFSLKPVRHLKGPWPCIVCGKERPNALGEGRCMRCYRKSLADRVFSQMCYNQAKKFGRA